jgi:hypothetical protein
MNERIKELSKEAGLVADATYAKAPDAIWLREYNKKFAELIVRECADMVDRAISDGGVDGRILKEHFGVKE